MNTMRHILPLVFLTLLALPAQAQTPPHPHGEITIDCAACHASDAWIPLRDKPSFDHNADTPFPLLNAHAQAQCQGCHENLRFDQPKLQTDDCASCHLDVHQGNLSDDCAACHTTTSFDDVDGLAIHAQTSFALTGAHLQTTCESCHRDDQGGAFTLLDTACIACHQQDYDQAASIDHATLGFPLECESCHNTLAWESYVTFDHATASNGFDLVGAHLRIRCESCHNLPGLEPLFQPTSQDDCLTCHQQDYDREHGGSGLPTTCLACHNADTWDDATFDHDNLYFPIYSGKHAGEWNSCQTCHSSTESYAIFTCLVCHEHNQQDMDDEHDDVAGYVYDSIQCYNCHPDGKEDD